MNKYIKTFENFNNKIGQDTYTDNDGFRVHQLNSSEELKMMEDRFWTDKKWITRDGDFDVYYWDNKQYDKEEEEYFWHTKTAIYIDVKNHIIKTKELLSEPLYKIRDEDKGMNREQERQVRVWTGTAKNPKYYMGTYLGMVNGCAIVKSNMGGKTTYKIDKDGGMYNLQTGEKLGE